MQEHGKYPMIAKGFTLIELMLAMVIGIFLMAGVFTVFTNGRTAQDTVEKQSRLVDDARFAVETLTNDLRYAGFFGKTNSYEYLRGEKNSDSAILPKTVPNPGDSLPAITDLIAPDCSPLWYADLKRAFDASNNMNLFAGTCVGAGYVPLTDVLVTKYAAYNEIDVDSLAEGVVYVYANYNSFGEIFIGQTAPTFLDGGIDEKQKGTIHRLRTRVYYIDKDTETNDNYPSLHRLDLDAGPKLSNLMLLPGVENLQIQYGIDSNGDGSINTYIDPDVVDEAQLAKVVAVQFWVTVRSRQVELPPGVTQTIEVAGQSTTYTNGFRRIVMSSVVMLRNKREYEIKSGG